MSEISIVQVKQLSETATVPVRKSLDSAGLDLYADLGGEGKNIVIFPGTTIKIKTGLAMALPQYTFGAIFARSGLATNEGLRPANCVGVCDADYRGEYIIPMYNDSDKARTIVHGERVAQLIVLPYIPATFQLVEELDETERGDGGFGSTGTN